MNTMTNRRKFLTSAGATTVALFAPSVVRATPTGSVGRDRLWIINIHNGEQINQPFIHRSARAHHQAWLDFSWFYRDTRDNDQVVYIDRTMLGKLADLQVALSGHRGEEIPIVMNSGYRTPERNATIPGAAANSLHCRGRATDLRLRGVSTRLAYQTARRVPGVGGVGYYPNSGFIHLDTGRTRTWTG